MHCQLMFHYFITVRYTTLNFQDPMYYLCRCSEYLQGSITPIYLLYEASSTLTIFLNSS
jgi:hypothetical protein